MEMEDSNGDLIGSYLKRVDDFSCECTRCSKVISVANLGLSAIHRHVKTIGHVSRTQGHVKLKKIEDCDEQDCNPLRQENKTDSHSHEFIGNEENVLLDQIIERLEDFADLVSCVELQLHRYHKLRFVLSGLEENNETRQEHDKVDEVDEAKLESIVKEEGSSYINDDITEEVCDAQIETLQNPKNRIVRRGKNHFKETWLEDIDTNGNNLKTYMEQHDEFSVWCYLCERAIAIDNQGQTAIMRHVKSQKHSIRLIKCQDTENTEDSFKSIVKEESVDSSSAKLSDVSKKENLVPRQKEVKKRGINHVKDNWFERMDSNGDCVGLYLRREGEHRVQCRWCWRSINTTNIGYMAVRRHFQSKSHRAVANMIPEKATFSDGDLDVRNIEFVCDTCGDCLRGLFKFRKHLRKHLADKQLKEVKEHSCPFCNMKLVVNYRTFLKHKRLCEVQHAVGEDFMCSVCGMSFPTHHLMYKHHYRCSGKGSGKRRLKKPCPYEGCDYSSFLNRDLDNHVNRVHLNKPLSRDFECHLCGKTYNRKHQLDQHVRGDHMNEKPHKCQTCGKAFVRRDKLTQHEATHTGEMRHKCPFCEKAFINHGTMWSHKKMCNFNLTKSLV